MNKYKILFVLFSIVSAIVNCQTRDLNYYLKAGLSNSPLLKDLSNQINSIAFDSLLIKANKKPLVEGKSQLLYSPAYKNFGYDEVVTDGGNYQAVVSVTQDIFAKKEITNKLEAYKIQRGAIRNSTKISVNELNKIITEQYLSAYSVLNDLNFNRSFLELIYKENEIVKQLVQSGIYKQTDYLSLLVETQTQEILISQLKSQYGNNLRILNQLCGIDDTATCILTVPDISIKGEPEVTRSPLFEQYKIDSLRILNDKAAVDVRYRMKVGWFADAGFLTSTPMNFYKHFGYSAGVTLSVPIYDGHQKNIEKQKLDLSESTRSGYQNNFKTQYSQQSRQLSDELNSLREMSVQLEKQLKTSEQLISALKSGLESGIVQMTEYLSAIKDFRFINKNLSDNRIRILQVINELNYLITQ